MTTHSASPEWSQSDPDYNRIGGYAAEYTKLHPEIMVATAAVAPGDFHCSPRRNGEDGEWYQVDPKATREGFFGLLDDATGLTTIPEADDDGWDWENPQ